MHSLKILFWVTAAVVSVLRGYYAATILIWDGIENKTVLTERKLPEDERRHWSWWAHQILINFAGSLIGWAAAYYLIFHRRAVDTVADGLLMLVSIAGIFGFLPYLVFRGVPKK